MPLSKAMGNLCFLFLFLLQVCTWPVVSHSLVKFLPRFQGPLPFQLETGYIGVNESENVQLFYYFIEPERNPEEDPLLLWLNGGPRCSAFSGLVYEIGPLNFEAVNYNGSLPKLVLNPHSWTKVSSIIFVDLPVGTGFSYARTPCASQSSDLIQVYQFKQFLRKWLMDHPEFLSNPLYIGGDSYSGNEEDIRPLLNIKGYLIGNPVTDSIIDGNSRIPFAHGMGLVSDELYKSLKGSCGGEYVIRDPSNTECLKHQQAFDKSTSGVNVRQILDPLCGFASPRPLRIISNRRSVHGSSQEFLNFKPTLVTLRCRYSLYPLSEYWANDNNVGIALHIREGTAGKWLRCNYGLPYKFDFYSSIKYHATY